MSFFREKKRSTNPNIWVRIFSVGGGVLPLEGVGAKKFGMSLETRETNLFGGYPGMLLGYPAVPEKIEKKHLCSIFGP